MYRSEQACCDIWLKYIIIAGKKEKGIKFKVTLCLMNVFILFLRAGGEMFTSLNDGLAFIKYKAFRFTFLFLDAIVDFSWGMSDQKGSVCDLYISYSDFIFICLSACLNRLVYTYGIWKVCKCIPESACQTALSLKFQYIEFFHEINCSPISLKSYYSARYCYTKIWGRPITDHVRATFHELLLTNEMTIRT